MFKPVDKDIQYEIGVFRSSLSWYIWLKRSENLLGEEMMAGIGYVCVFLFLGLFLSHQLFRGEPMPVRVWAGVLFALLGLMWAPVPFAFAYGFTIPVLIGGMALMAGVSLGGTLFLSRRTGFSKLEGKATPLFYSIVITVTLVVGYILFRHVLLPRGDVLYSGRSTWGDLPVHLSIISVLAEQGTFPPDYPIFPGAHLGYPFLVNLVSASFRLLGWSLRWSVLIPSWLFLGVLSGGFYFLARRFLRDALGVALAAVLFFVNGGLGVVYYLEGAWENPGKFFGIFSDFANSPTNYIEHNIRWSTIVCDMLVPQRTTLAGWAVLFFVLWMLKRAMDTHDRRQYLLAGLAGGLLPMVHTHSFLGLVVVAVVWFLVFFVTSPRKGAYFVDWLMFALPLAALSLPQVWYWTVPQSVEGGFVRWQPGWVNQADIWPWFWIKNAGLAFILIFPALFGGAGRQMRKFYLGAVAVFVLSETVVFQPWDWDNIKLHFVWYIFTAFLVADYVSRGYYKLPAGLSRKVLLVFLVVAFSLSGALSIGRDLVLIVPIFSTPQQEAGEFIREHTPPDAVFLSADHHAHPISPLAGRFTYVGFHGLLWSHGIDFHERAEAVRLMFEDSEKFPELADEHGIDYVYISDDERRKFEIDFPFFFENYPMVFEARGIMVFAVSERAIAWAENVEGGL